MILLDCKQGGAKWIQARLGIPTASSFDRILTPSTRKPSNQAPAYMRTLLSEWLIGEPSDAGATQFMERGIEVEPLARRWYAFDRDVDVREVGLVLRDDRMAGASPDGLVGEDGTLEIKAPSASTHVGYLLDDGAGLRCYFAQVQGALWLTGRKWADILSFHPSVHAVPPVVVRIPRDDSYIELLDAAVSAFVRELLAAREQLERLGCRPAEKLMIPASMVKDDPF